MDTAAAVTIISDSIFRELEPKPPYFKKGVLHTAERDTKMEFCCWSNGPEADKQLHRVSLCKVVNLVVCMIGFTDVHR